jgi:hypothetical protein
MEMWTRAVGYFGQAVTIDGVPLSQMFPFFSHELIAVPTSEIFSKETVVKMASRAAPNQPLKFQSNYDVDAVHTQIKAMVPLKSTPILEPLRPLAEQAGSFVGDVFEQWAELDMESQRRSEEAFMDGVSQVAEAVENA